MLDLCSTLIWFSCYLTINSIIVSSVIVYVSLECQSLFHVFEWWYILCHALLKASVMQSSWYGWLLHLYYILHYCTLYISQKDLGLCVPHRSAYLHWECEAQLFSHCPGDLCSFLLLIIEPIVPFGTSRLALAVPQNFLWNEVSFKHQ